MNNLSEYLTRHDPEGVALSLGDHRLTYRKLESLSSRAAAALRNLGISAGDRVAPYLPNDPAFVIACLGLLKLGAVVDAINTAFEQREASFILEDSGSKAIVRTAKLRSSLGALPSDPYMLITEEPATAEPGLCPSIERQPDDVATADVKKSAPPCSTPRGPPDSQKAPSIAITTLDAPWSPYEAASNWPLLTASFCSCPCRTASDFKGSRPAPCTRGPA